MLILKILLALLMLSILVTVHEFGHFVLAKLTGVKVNEFAVGMGPRLFHWGKGETVYSLRAFPIGGFCSMEGEDEGADTPQFLGGNGTATASDPTRSFTNKKVWQRFLIIVAGPVMNLILGYGLLLVYCGILMQPYTPSNPVLFSTTTIATVEKTSPAYATGLRPGDTILSVNGRRVLLDTDLIMEMQNDPDGILDMVVRRTDENGNTAKVTLPGVTFTLETDEETGQTYLKYDFKILGKKRTFLNTFPQAAKEELSLATIVWRSLADIVRGRYGLNDLSGPVGTVEFIADAVGNATSLAGWQNLVMLMTLITVNLGVFNLLPLPALDGGRLAFILWEAVTRHPVKPKYEGVVHLVGLILLLLFMVVITYSDITRIFF